MSETTQEDIVTQTEETAEPEKKNKWVIIALLISAVAALIAIALWIVLSVVPAVSESPGDESVDTNMTASQVWESEVGAPTKTVVTEGYVAVQIGGGVAVLEDATGKVVYQVDTPDEHVSLTRAGNIPVLIEPERVGVWDTSTESFENISVRENDQVRALGESVFIISEDRTSISRITKELNVEEVGAPVSGAAPLAGLDDGSVVWATGKREVIIVDAENNTVSENALDAPEDAAELSRWFGANNDYVFTQWDFGDTQMLVVHDVHTGEVITAGSLDGADGASWRETSKRNIATVANFVVDLETGMLAEFSGPIEDVAPLQDSFAGVLGQEGLVFDHHHVETFEVGDVRKIQGETGTGLVLMSDGGVLQAVQGE